MEEDDIMDEEEEEDLAAYQDHQFLNEMGKNDHQRSNDDDEAEEEVEYSRYVNREKGLRAADLLSAGNP